MYVRVKLVDFMSGGRMMNIRFLKRSKENILDYLKKYYNENSIFIDVFWEERVMKSSFYEIQVDGKFSGVCGIFESNMIMVLAIELEYRHLQYKIFEEVKRLENVQYAAVTTSDEMFMGLAFEYSKDMEKDSYYSIDSKRKIIDLERLELKLAMIEDLRNIENVTEGYYSNLEEKIKSGQVYLAIDGKEVVGVGHFVNGILFNNQVNIGMYVNSKYRGLGYGTEILIRLKELAYMVGKEPISGCWAYNHNSLKAQIKAGMSMKARFLKFKI